MIDKPFLINPTVLPAGNRAATPLPEKKEAQVPFEQLLREELQGNGKLRFSRHAQNRLAERRITLDGPMVNRLQQAVAKAQSKGCRESLVVLDDLAFVVSIKNNMVITAVDGENRKENVFTNIDSAVII